MTKKKRLSLVAVGVLIGFSIRPIIARALVNATALVVELRVVDDPQLGCGLLSGSAKAQCSLGTARLNLNPDGSVTWQAPK